MSDAAGAWTISGVRAGIVDAARAAQRRLCLHEADPVHVRPHARLQRDVGRAIEFGNHVSRSVSGIVFSDADADGLAREAGEPGVAGWIVYSDANDNSSLDPAEPRSTYELARHVQPDRAGQRQLSRSASWPRPA